MRFNLHSRGAAWSALALVAVLSAGACASSHSRTGGGTPNTVTHLTNDLTPPADVTVFAVTQGGIRRLLGDLPPNSHKVLRIPGSIQPGTTFRLVAERTIGRPIVSQPITASSEDMMIDWDLQTNSMWFPTEEGS